MSQKASPQPAVEIVSGSDAPRKWETVGKPSRLVFDGTWSFSVRLQRSLENGRIFLSGNGPKNSRFFLPGTTATIDGLITALQHVRAQLVEVEKKK